MRKFLCTMDPFFAAMVIIIAILYGGLAVHKGIGVLAFLILFGVIGFVIIAGVAFLLYKAIVFAQSKCKEYT